MPVILPVFIPADGRGRLCLTLEAAGFLLVVPVVLCTPVVLFPELPVVVPFCCLYDPPGFTEGERMI